MSRQRKVLLVMCCIAIIAFVAFVTNTYLAEFSKVSEASLEKDGTTNGDKSLSPNEILGSKLEEMISSPSFTKLEMFNKTCDQSTAACTSSCPKLLSSSPKQRLLEILSSSNLTLSRRESEDILSVGQLIPESDVIILSASSSNHYNEMQAMFQNLHNVVFPLVKNITVVLFDIGLTKEQTKHTEKHCRCKVIRFPTEKFPPHVKNNHCYSWKPIIVKATIQKARKLFIYQDSAIRWTKEISSVLARASAVGVQIFRYSSSARIPIHTLKQTFAYFGEEPCTFDPFPEILGGFVIMNNNTFNTRAILEPWAKCALTSECMCPVNPQSVLSCSKPVANHRCHRFDQSALGMITAKIFGNDIYRVIAPDLDRNVYIKREDVAPNYFKTL